MSVKPGYDASLLPPMKDMPDDIFVPPFDFVRRHFGATHPLTNAVQVLMGSCTDTGKWRPTRSSSSAAAMTWKYRAELAAALQKDAPMPEDPGSFVSRDQLSTTDRDRPERARRITEDRNRKYRR